MLWGNYSGFATNTVNILQGIQQKSKNVKYIEGAGFVDNTVLVSRYGNFRTRDGKPGMSGTYYNNVEMKGEPVAKATYAAPISYPPALYLFPQFSLPSLLSSPSLHS